MYKFNEIKELHIELTSNCQLSCPMCARNQHGGLENPLVKIKSIDLTFFKKICSEDFIKQLTEIIMCGNFGDPIINNDLIPIVEYITKKNPNITIDLHTNGSARSTTWWRELADVMPVNHLVHFAVDGLSDTLQLYRKNANFEKIMENAKSFIDAGGKTRWVYIKFKHNEHQVNEAFEMSKKIGFGSFQEKQTSRFFGNPWFDVHDQNGNITHKLEASSDHTESYINPDTITQYQTLVDNVEVSCYVEKILKSIYIDALGYVWPCCFTASTLYIYSNPDQLIYNYVIDSKKSLNKVLDQFGGLEQLNLDKRSIEEIVNDDLWQTLWNNNTVGKGKLHVCARNCGKFKDIYISQSKDTFLDEEKKNVVYNES
jgi:MoaA/NifB/PqqE/SkfB family radical SAM enzyme